jgi:hypothetical protein
MAARWKKQWLTTLEQLVRGRGDNFGVRELAPAFAIAGSSAGRNLPRRVAAMKSGDKSPHSKFQLSHAVRSEQQLQAELDNAPRVGAGHIPEA